MKGDEWRTQGSPPEASSRVTNPERFASLHMVAAELLDQLELEFDAERAEGDGLAPELEGSCKSVRPSITLVPRDADAAPVVFVFSAFPGIRVRFGRWYITAFPKCGCDACDESAESEAERLKSLIDNLTAGRFRESIRIGDDGSAWKESEFWSASGSDGTTSQLDPTCARQLISATARSSYDWVPWPRRG